MPLPLLLCLLVTPNAALPSAICCCVVLCCVLRDCQRARPTLLAPVCLCFWLAQASQSGSLLAPPFSASARPLHLLCHPWLRLLCYSFPRLSPCLPTAPLPLPPLLLLVHTRSIPLSHHASPSAAYACQHQHTAECLLLQACSSPLCVPVNLTVNDATATAAAVVAVPNAAGVTVRRRGGRDDGMGGGRRAAQCR